MNNQKKSKQKSQPTKITIKDYLKAVKKADREIALSKQPGFQSVSKIHKNKKGYDRRDNKRIAESED